MNSFPYGKAAFSILILALLSGLWLGLHPIPKKTVTLSVWTFANTHAAAYQKAIPSFEAAHPGVKVEVQLVNGQAVTSRLQAAFWAELDVPDLVEVEISSAGAFFRGPQDAIGFADLTDRIKNSGLWEGMVQARFAPYTHRGRIYGFPHDVHPVLLAYRRDIFEQEGVDVNKIQTWDDFIAVGKRLTIPGKRYMMELSDSSRDNLETMLFQRDGALFDPEGKVVFDNDIGVETMLFYIPLVAGKDKIGNTLGDNQILTQAVEDGYLLCLIAPDWRTKGFEQDIPKMKGKMALMPMPAVAPGKRRTSSWGGTMLGIAKKCKNQDLAWELALHLYLNKKELAGRFRDTNILPPLREAWTEPAYNEPRPYWSNQPLGALYIEQATQVPYQYASPFVVTAKAKLAEALVACVQYYNQNGRNGEPPPRAEFEKYVRTRLKQSADEVRRLMSRNPY